MSTLEIITYQAFETKLANYRDFVRDKLDILVRFVPLISVQTVPKLSIYATFMASLQKIENLVILIKQ